MRYLRILYTALMMTGLYAGLLQAQSVINGDPNVTVKTGDSTTSVFHVFNSTSTVDLLRVQATGNVGIGTTAPVSRLSVYSAGPATIAMGNTAISGGTNTVVGYLSGRSDNQAETASFGGVKIITDSTLWYRGRLGFFTNNVDGTDPTTPATEKMTITAAGSVGVGTTLPASKFSVYSAGPTTIAMGNTAVSGATNAVVGYLCGRADNQAEPASFGGMKIVTDSTTWYKGRLGFFTNNIDGTDPTMPATEKMTITAAGNVGIGSLSPSDLLTVGNVGGTSNKMTVNGDVTVTGNIAAKYQDVAEWVPASTSMIPGTVAILNTERRNEVMPSNRAYDTTVAGVVSAQPGLILGEAGDSKARIATTGRVKVRVDASSHPVKIGDLLVTSNKSGLAMVSEPLDLGGIKIHRPGTLIGKALEPLANGEGEILVLLSLQ